MYFIKVIKSLPTLSRLGISIAVTFSAITGYIVANGFLNDTIIFLAFGVFSMAAGASALNQYQERNTDKLMKRTKNRPIPSGKIGAKTVLLISIFLTFAGFIVLYIACGILPAMLGLFNLFWYNGIYTPLKKKTAFAVIPGSITGVTPILIGWTAANGYIFNPTVILISFFIYMWQVPHFWLLLIKYNDEYKNAGLGILYKSFTAQQAKRIVYMWILATSLASLLITSFGVISSPVLCLFLIFTNLAVVISFYVILFNKSRNINFKLASVQINSLLLITLILLILDSLKSLKL